MKNLYVGLDTAETMGVALYYPKNRLALVTEVKGTPIEQYIYITNNILLPIGNDKEQVLFIIEKLTNFLNAKTTRSLLERIGYLKYTLLSNGQLVEELAPTIARKTLGIRSNKRTVQLLFQKYTEMKLSDNHTDALALVVHRAVQDGYPLNIGETTIKEFET